MSNRGMEMTVQSVSFFDKLQGLEASRNGYRFAAVKLELKNTTEKKIEYQIPSIFMHFYMGIDGGQYPASNATWLMENPVTKHGDPSVRIPPNGTVTGTLVFLVPYTSGGYPQQSLHFYDTAYGHIQMPIAGGAPDKWAELEKMPTASTGKLSDTFTMNVTASEVKTGLDQYKPGANAAFRVVEAELTSNVQALLNIDPAKRAYLSYPSKSGVLMAAMSPVTKYMPLGFYDSVMLGPASGNVVRLAYDVPRSMEEYKSELYFDISDGSAVFGVTQGQTYGAPAPAAEFDTEFMKVTVNQLVQLREDLEYPTPGGGTGKLAKGSVIADVTFTDIPQGGLGTRVPRDFFTLVNKNYRPATGSGTGAAHGGGGADVTTGRIGLGGFADTSGGSRAGEYVNPSGKNNGLIFGIGDNFNVFGRMSRRVIVIFDDPRSDAADWTLQSIYYDNIYAQVTAGAFASPELLAWKAEIKE